MKRIAAEPIIEAMKTYMLEHDLSMRDLSNVLDVDDKRIRQIFEQDSMDFDLADRILCKLDMVDLWYGPLRVVYDGVDLSRSHRSDVRNAPKGERRCESAGCINTFPEKKPNRFEQRFCSPQCQKTEWLRQSRESRTLNARRYDSCPSGHDRSPENLYIAPDGSYQCRVCNRTRRKEQREALLAA